MDNLTEYDRITILNALQRRIKALWSIYPHSKRQHLIERRYKLLFEKLGGDSNHDYEEDIIKDIDKL